MNHYLLTNLATHVFPEVKIMVQKPLFLCRIYLPTKIILILMYMDCEIEKEEPMSLKSENFCVRALGMTKEWMYVLPFLSVRRGEGERATSVEGSPLVQGKSLEADTQPESP